MKLFKGKNLLEFAKHINSGNSCLEYLALIKWQNGSNL